MLAEAIMTTERRVSIALHGAAGIVFAVIAVELMPRVLENTKPWIVVLGFCIGGVLSIVLKQVVKRVQAQRGGKAGPWMIYIAVSTDLFTDGLLIGTGSAVSFSLALLLAVAQVLADIPEGFASIANFRSQRIPRRTRVLLSLGFAIPILVAAIGSYWLLRDASSAWQMGILSVATGMLVVLAVEDIVPEAHESEDFPLATGAVIGGFALFTLISSYFGA
ncbi:peptidoglycan-binding protein [Alkalilimnicola sp. S0819]|nr:peptidoglycan-binding protein [Alkalilimnicola sp. S0819]MPQ16937.1 peptidoglycan-binding protein [Alkalilimnicola sp. S0819]